MYMYVYVFEAKFERRNHRFEFSEKPWNVNILFFKTITTREIMSKKKQKITRNIAKYLEKNVYFETKFGKKTIDIRINFSNRTKNREFPLL